MHYAGCYCTTVYKRLTPLAGCAVITTRHVLTTATSTHLILRDRQNYEVLENILGVWYDTNHNVFNSSMYLTPARIHYHPKWHYPEQVNRSHPFSFTFDLAVWASTYTIYGWYFNSNSATVCLRATSRWTGPPTPSGELLHIVVGFQFMYAYNRKPMPWYKYAVRSWRYTEPCPKTEWGWFICIPGDWARFGVESGAALHRTDVGSTWKYDGLIGLGAFSMKLRSAELIHYFTVLDSHPVLDFIYDAYTGSIPYIWKDKRFKDSKYKAPELLPQYYLYRDYRLGEQHPYYPIYMT
nr:uncharacterized protein LOC117993414 [Maniola hyperantus]